MFVQNEMVLVATSVLLWPQTDSCWENKSTFNPVTTFIQLLFVAEFRESRVRRLGIATWNHSFFSSMVQLRGCHHCRYLRPRYAKGAVQYSTLDAAEGGYRTSALGRYRGHYMPPILESKNANLWWFMVILRDFPCNNSALFGLFPGISSAWSLGW